MDTPRVLRPVREAFFLIERRLEPRCRAHGVSSNEGHLLVFLLDRGPCAVSDVHRVFGYKRSTLTSLLDRLESRELLVRSSDPHDGRSFRIDLRPRGRKLALKLRRILRELDKALVLAAGEGNVRGFWKVMEAIAKMTRKDR